MMLATIGAVSGVGLLGLQLARGGVVAALVAVRREAVRSALGGVGVVRADGPLGGLLWLGDALRSLRDDHAATVLAGFRDLARDDGDRADYG